MRILLGVVFGMVIGAGGYHLYRHVLASRTNTCLDRCGEGTRCRDAHCVADVQPARPARPKARRGSRLPRSTDDGEAGRPPSAAELEVRSEGPTLQGVDYVNPSENDGAEHQLSAAEVETKVRALDTRVVGCIDRARGQIDFRTGQVIVAFRIERSGRVEKVRVTAPAALQRAGIYACLRLLVASLSFPASSRALVMRYPYSLR
jgi:hypothetical protein